ncbi:hypothetical protein [Streptomyces anthocyanicus]|uniref:hypothetical protein n=1 Tax=Streptomyces anthocyanicus TaxID=68174 RepID=UPI00382C4C05
MPAVPRPDHHVAGRPGTGARTPSQRCPDAPAEPADSETTVIRAVQVRITSGSYAPGARLTLEELRRSTGHPARRLRPALDHLAAEGTITLQWRIPDTRPDDHPAVRTRDLLAAMIDHGAYPAGTPLPARGVLAPLLLARPADLDQALRRLAAEHIISVSGNARPHVLEPRPGHPARTPWPHGPHQQVLDALPRARRQGAGHDRAALAQVRHAARKRWNSGAGPNPCTMTDQEQRQAETLHRLISRALAHTTGHDPRSATAVRSAAARSMACAALPTHGPVHERLFRFTVLAAALHDLIEALTSASPRGNPR